MKRGVLSSLAAGICLLLLILDAKTAFSGAMEGIALCIQALIPSLFPFLVLSMVLTSSLAGQLMPVLRPIGRFTGMPRRSESLLVVGLLGGYPVGAQNVSQAYREGRLSKENAHRLLGFCSNAGPAFLFGIVAGKFQHISTVWVLWAIHILSALLTGLLLPGRSNERIELTPAVSLTLPQALERSVKVMATICGWVILFRIILAFCCRWFLWLFPDWVQVIWMSLTELTNGCCALDGIALEGMRFVVAAGILSFGGICVMMQTVSVTDKLGMGLYFPGKLIQTLISILLSGSIQYLLFPADSQFTAIPLIVASFIGLIVLNMYLKITKKE